jgi:CRISPR-associated protein Csb2
MALAAAFFETERDDAEKAALCWLETLGDPELLLPPSESVFTRSVVDVYVPVNDKAEPSKALLQTTPGLTRDRQPRTFPATWVGDAVSYARWSKASDFEQHVPALRRLCSKVTRIGHASSLVRMWVADELPGNDETIQSWEPTDTIAELYVRKVSPKFFESLKDLYGEVDRIQHQQLSATIESLKAEKKKCKGKGTKEREAEIDQHISEIEVEQKSINPRPPIRPVVGLWRGYRRIQTPTSPKVAQSYFDTDLLTLAQQSGPRLPLEATLQVMQALRGTVMSRSSIQPPPEWVSGHSEDGKPSKRKEGHLALIPLPFVGHEHADGHLLGVALALPRSIARHERGKCIGPLLLDHQGQPKTVDLILGRLGIWTLSKREWSDPRLSLKPESWTDSPSGATTWGSVTPFVLDRFPKSNRLKDRVGWNEEVAETVKRACVRIGLPEPIEVDLDTTSWFRGAPRASGKRRRLRNGIDGLPHADAAFGDVFPAFPAKGTNASRPQIHVWLRFAQPVVGPVLIGAGRYLGYGLFKPLHKIREGELS